MDFRITRPTKRFPLMERFPAYIMVKERTVSCCQKKKKEQLENVNGGLVSAFSQSVSILYAHARACKSSQEGPICC